MRIKYLYIQIDPITNEPRYVGFTSRIDLKVRLREHLSERNSFDTHKCRWLRKLNKQGYKPTINGIYCNISDIDEALILEREVIEEYRKIGYKLTNSTNGGEVQKVFTKDVCKKISDSLKRGHQLGTIVPHNKGRKMTQEEYDNFKSRKIADTSGEKNSFYGKKHSEESLEKMRKVHKKHDYTIEQLRKLYCEDGLLQKEISVITGVCRSQICRLIKRYNLQKKIS